jgi:hypothetical protein
VHYISSAGLRAVISIMKSLKAAGKPFKIIRISDEVKDVFETTGLVGLFIRDEKYIIIKDNEADGVPSYTIAGKFTDVSFASLASALRNEHAAGKQHIVLNVSAETAEDHKFIHKLIALRGELAEGVPSCEVDINVEGHEI